MNKNYQFINTKNQIMKTNYKNYFSVLALFLCTLYAQFSTAQCTGTATTTSQGVALTSGYNWTFETVGTNVKITITLNDAKSGLNAYLWRETGGFQETGMTPVAGQAQTYTVSIPGPALGQNFKCEVKFAFAGGLSVTKTFTYVMGENCTGGPADTTKPTGFAASVGTNPTSVTSNSVELLVNGSDDSGSVIYVATAMPGNITATAIGTGAEQSLIVKGLTPNTSYTFSVTAKDAAGNAADNSPISANLAATTLVDNSTPCAGSSTESQVGFSPYVGAGFNYTVVSSGGNTTFTFNILDNTTLNNAYLENNQVGEKIMTISNGGKTATYTLPLADGVVINWAIKVVTAGEGVILSRSFNYTGGDACATALGVEDQQLASNAVKLYPNPANKGIVTVDAGDLKVSKVEIYSILGAKVLETNKTAIATNGLQAGVYFVKIYADGKSITKKLVVN
jgi:hypothetical protein